jgi:hypothetical protein
MSEVREESVRCRIMHWITLALSSSLQRDSRRVDRKDLVQW